VNSSVMNDWEVKEETESLCEHFHTQTIEVLKSDFDTGAQWLDAIERCTNCGVRV
jgi:hypothetical protein